MQGFIYLFVKFRNKKAFAAWTPEAQNLAP